MIRIGERHDGEGRLVRGVRHIRGAGTEPGILAIDSADPSGNLYYVQMKFRDYAFTSAQVKLLHGTPQIIVPAPGAGYFLQFVCAHLMLDYSTNAFTETADNMQIVYGVSAAVVASQTIEGTGFIDQTADTYTTALPKIDVIATKAQLDNIALYLYNANDEYAGNASGLSVLRIRTFYLIHQILAA